MSMLRGLLASALALTLAACGSNPPAPVIDRLPSSKSDTVTTGKTTKKSSKPVYKAGDWRPDTYTVKKGDTLFSIGLEFGYDYKDIAQLNNLASPYVIKVGQVLKLGALKDKADVVVTPIANDNTPAVITEPKATREVYSEEKKPAATSDKEVAKPADTAEAKSVEDIDWAWPTKGKVSAVFNDTSNKGIDITGSMGQPVNAAAAGKVIYSGSDLRSYGKLVIIKHNPTYLSVYAYNSAIVVKEGQLVTIGQKIAEMGSYDGTTPKLHFEIRRQGKSVDPSKYLN